MMVFMLILKIIGIVLCVIIGILAMILFVPVCYKVDADIDEMDYTVRARWLGWLIRFEFRWKEKAHAVLKILWFVIDLTDPEAVAVRKANKEVKARKKQEKKPEGDAADGASRSGKEHGETSVTCQARPICVHPTHVCLEISLCHLRL